MELSFIFDLKAEIGLPFIYYLKEGIYISIKVKPRKFSVEL